MQGRHFLVLIDAFILLVAFTTVVITKNTTLDLYFQNYFTDILLILILWYPVSGFYKKYRTIKPRKPIRRFMFPIIQSNISILGLGAIVMMIRHEGDYSNAVIIGTVVNATLGEILVWNGIHYIGRLRDTIDEAAIVRQMRTKTEATETSLKRVLNNLPADPELYKNLHNELRNEVGEEVFRVLDHWVNMASPECQIVSTTTRFNIAKLNGKFKCFVNLKRLNDVRYLNKFFETINGKLSEDGIFIGFAETKDLRKQRILRKYPPVLNYLAYSLDFLIKRVFPKFKLTQHLYFLLTRGENRVLSKAEIFGRLYSCGFEVLDEAFVNRHLYFLAKKAGDPHYDPDPTYGPLIKLSRIGKGGKIIKVYKFRTMHPYAEYLQDYIFKKYNLQKGGKFREDFRVSTLGRIMRRFWIDEIPMIINLVKGDLKIVGVRPLSKHYFSLYDPELQKKRIAYKPGLIPPFYADMPHSLEEIQDSERRYLEAYAKHPLRTDLKYFFKALWNILFRNARSN